jgi:hypothetical protein
MSNLFIMILKMYLVEQFYFTHAVLLAPRLASREARHEFGPSYNPGDILADMYFEYLNINFKERFVWSWHSGKPYMGLVRRTTASITLS